MKALGPKMKGRTGTMILYKAGMALVLLFVAGVSTGSSIDSLQPGDPPPAPTDTWEREANPLQRISLSLYGKEEESNSILSLDIGWFYSFRDLFRGFTLPGNLRLDIDITGIGIRCEF